MKFRPQIFRHLSIGLLLCLPLMLTAQTPGSYHAVDFEGTGDNLTIANHSSLNPRNAITVEAWIKADGYGSNVWSNSIVDKHDWISGNAGYVLRCGSGGVLSWNWSSRNTGAWVETNSAAVMSTGVWYHVAGTFDGDTSRVYINGVLQNSTAHSSQINISSSAIRMGAMTYGKGRYFDGSVDEVRIWSAALSESTLRDWMCRKVTASHPNNSALEGYWKMDEGTSTSVKDNSSNSNGGTLSSSKAWINSGAALGDSVIHTYTGSTLKETTPFGEKIEINNIKGSPTCTHLYMINEGSVTDIDPLYYGLLDTTHYFGVYQAGGTSATFDLEYSYKGNGTYSGTKDCGFDLLAKPIGHKGNWKSRNPAIQYAQDSLKMTSLTSSEFSNVLYPPDSVLYMKSSNGRTWFCEGESIMLIAAGNDSFTYKWYENNKLIGNNSNRLRVDSTGSFRVEATRNGTSCTFKSRTMNVTSQKKPTVTLNSLKGACEDVDTIVLKGGLPKGGIYTGVNILRDSLFFPSRVKSGTYRVVYSYTDPSTTCTSTDTADQVVWALPNVFVSGYTTVCDNLDSSLLNNGVPSGGTFAGPGISNNYFHPSAVNFKTGLYPYSYTFTDTNQCSNRFDDSLELLASPNVFLLPIRVSCENDAPFKLLGSPNQGTYTGKGINGTDFNPKQAGEGSHQIIYNYTASNGCSDSDTQTAIVHKNSAVSWNSGISVCLNSDSVKLKEGTPSGGSFEGTGVKGSYFYPSLAGVGTHSLSYVFVDSNSCSNKATDNALVNDTSAITVQDVVSLCPGDDKIKLAHAQPSGGTYSGSHVSNDSFDLANAAVGAHQVMYRYLNSDACQSERDYTIQILTIDKVSIDLPDGVCDGADPVQVKVSPTGGTVSGKGIIGSFFSPTFAGVGTHVISYEITESHGCDVKVTDTIEVAEIPTVSLNLPLTSFCEQDANVELSGGQPLNGVFRINNVTADSIKPTELGEGTHSVRYSYANQFGCADSTENDIYVNANPIKPAISKIDGTLRSSASSGNQWYNTTGKIDGETNREFSPTATDNYYVIVTSDSGCTTTSDSFYFQFISLPEIHKETISIYPNPSTGFINIKGLNASTQYEILDARGNAIRAGSLAPQESLNLVNLPDGMYILRLEHAEGVSNHIIRKIH